MALHGRCLCNSSGLTWPVLQVPHVALGQDLTHQSLVSTGPPPAFSPRPSRCCWAPGALDPPGARSAAPSPAERSYRPRWGDPPRAVWLAFRLPLGLLLLLLFWGGGGPYQLPKAQLRRSPQCVAAFAAQRTRRFPRASG